MDVLISLLVLLVIVGLVYWAITQIPLPQPVRIVAVVLVVLIAIILLLNYLPGVHLAAR